MDRLRESDFSVREFTLSTSGKKGNQNVSATAVKVWWITKTIILNTHLKLYKYIFDPTNSLDDKRDNVLKTYISTAGMKQVKYGSFSRDVIIF